MDLRKNKRRVWQLPSVEVSVVCVRLVALHVVCFRLPDWKPERLTPKIVKEKGPIMQ
jgi:hypothetical protein